ncbi:MAG TPA: VIT1/CCC1 transporter family protein [Casimicrobiaceae bacterium]|nr:VIT1/CCC1 transporter family protein [Casimicrobiaceae bacterium]
MATLFDRFAESFKASFGDIVFGMEDGTVSIFGLVFGVAASTSDTRVVLVAGLAGAISAAVSMMAGEYLDAETARDQAREHAASVDPSKVADAAMRARLLGRGVPAAAVDELNALGTRYPTLPRALHLAFDEGDADAEASPIAHALWMFVSDLVAALVPVAPFAFLPMSEARYVSIACTAAVLVVLGVGRARIGKRRLLPTTLQTLGIAAAAGIAGVAVGHFFA